MAELGISHILSVISSGKIKDDARFTVKTVIINDVEGAGERGRRVASRASRFVRVRVRDCVYVCVCVCVLGVPVCSTGTRAV